VARKIPEVPFLQYRKHRRVTVVFDLVQILAKLIIIAGIVLAALYASVHVWHADIDLRSLASPVRALKDAVDEQLGWLPTREKDALYLGGKIIGRVFGDAVVDESSKQIVLPEIYDAEGVSTLLAGSEFEFQKWRLKLRSTVQLNMLETGAPRKPPRMLKVRCQILGTRSPL